MFKRGVIKIIRLPSSKQVLKNQRHLTKYTTCPMYRI